MLQARDIKRRIRSIQSTRQITNTMEMVAASKLRRAQERVRSARPYASKLSEVISGLLTPELSQKYPVLRQPETVSRSALIVLTSNRGLAGAFNANIIRMAREVLSELRASGVEVELHLMGRRGIGYFSYVGEAMATARDDITDRPSVDDARSIIDGIIPRFESGAIDAIDIVYGRMVSALSTPPTRMRVLPVEPQAEEGERRSLNYILEPSPDEILTFVLPLYVRNAIYRALVETAAAEHAARRTAMKNATDNADELLTTLTRDYNRARQTQITSELTEIVGGADALRG